MVSLFEVTLFITTFVFFMRTILIIGGKLKGPILRHFEYYGPDEFFYQPLPAFLGWFGAFIIALDGLLNVKFLFMPIVILFWIVGFGIWSTPELSMRYPRLLLRYPIWLHEIRQRTGRYERRRIAYMWLRLPRRLRNTYNSNDNAFREWADFIILGTLR